MVRRDGERSSEERGGEDDKVDAGSERTSEGEHVERVKCAIVRLLLFILTFLCRFLAVSCWRKGKVR